MTSLVHWKESPCKTNSNLIIPWGGTTTITNDTMSNDKMTTTQSAELTSAPPPWHTVALLGGLIGVFAATFPSLETIDEDANVATFTHRAMPDLVSVKQLGWIRCVFSLFIFSVSFKATFFYPGMTQVTTYLPNSKLKRNVLIRMTGVRTQLPFTSWSWNFLGVSFALNGIIALRPNNISPWMLRIALLLFEMAAPSALLVAFVIRYAIWPRVLQEGETTQLKSPMVLIWHNANVIMVLTEVCLLGGGMPIRAKHVSVAPALGIVYVLFTWFMVPRWSSEGPQFIYFFLDTTLGSTTSIALLILLVVLIVFYGLFGALYHILSNWNEGCIMRTLATILLSSLVCRFRD